MTRPAFEMADIVRRKGRQFLQRFKAILSYQQLKAYRAIERCRTAITASPPSTVSASASAGAIMHTAASSAS